MKLKRFEDFKLNENATSASNAYHIVSMFLSKKDANTMEEALDKYGDELEAKLGSPYADALYTILDGYYDMDKYAPDGVPIDEFWEVIEDEI